MYDSKDSSINGHQVLAIPTFKNKFHEQKIYFSRAYDDELWSRGFLLLMHVMQLMKA